MTPDEIRRYWEARGPVIEAGRKPKGKGKQDPSPWIAYSDYIQLMEHLGILLKKIDTDEELLQEFAAQLGEVRDTHKREIERLNNQHALTLQKYMRGV